MKKLNFKVRLAGLFLAFAAMLCCAVLGGLLAGQNTQSASAMTTESVTNVYSGADIWNSAKNEFDTNGVKDLLVKLGKGAGSDIDTKSYSALKSVYSGPVKSNAIAKANDGANGLVVKFGGYKWTVTYLSTDNNGDLIATLWYADTEIVSCFSADASGNSWRSSTQDGGFAGYTRHSNHYGGSYMRAVVLGNGGDFWSASGSTVSANSSVTKVTATAAQVNGSAFNLFAKGAISNYLVAPNSVPWQQSGQYYSSFNAYMLQNDNLTNVTDNWYNDNIKNSQSDELYYQWGKDKVWLPSIPEAKSSGIWGTTTEQRKSTSSTSADWTRSGVNDKASSVHYFTKAGTTYYESSSGSHGVRPAIHLNLKSVAETVGVGVFLPTKTAEAKTYTGQAIVAIEDIEADKVNITSATFKDYITGTPAPWTTTPSNGKLSATQSGEYEVTFSLKNTYPYSDVEWSTDKKSWVHKTLKEEDGLSTLVVPFWEYDGLGISEEEAQTEAGYEKLIANHTVKFTINRAKITASWSGGTNFEYTYNGTAQSPTYTLSGEQNGENVVLITEYKDKTGAWVTTAPANSGNYTKRIKLDAASSSAVNANYVLWNGTEEVANFSQEYAIAAEFLTVKWYGESSSTTDFSWVFNGNKQAPAAKLYGSDGTTEVTDAVLSYTYALQSDTGTLESDGGAPLHVGDYVVTAALANTSANANYAFKMNATLTQNFTITPLAAQNLQWWQDSGHTEAWGSDSAYTYDNNGHRPYATAEDVDGNLLAMTFTFQKVESGSPVGEPFTAVPKEAGTYRIIAHEANSDYTMTGVSNASINYTIDKLSVAVSWDWTGFTDQHIEYNGIAQAPTYSATANNVYTDGSVGDKTLTLSQVVKLAGVTQVNGAIGYSATAYSIAVSLSADDAKNYVLTDATQSFYIDKHTIQADEIHFYNDGTEVSKTKLEFVFGTQPNLSAKAIFEVNGVQKEIELIADGNGYNPYYDPDEVPVWPQRAYTYTVKLATADTANFTVAASDLVLNFAIVAAKVQAEEMSVVWVISNGAGGYTQISANYQFTYNGAIQKPIALGYFVADQDDPATAFVITNSATYHVLSTVGTNYKNAGNYVAWAKPDTSNVDISYFISDGTDEFAYEIIAVEVEVEWTVAAKYTYIAGTKQGPTLAATTAGAAAIGTTLANEFKTVLTVSQAIDAGDQLATATAGKNFVLVLTDGTKGETLTKAFYINKLKLTSLITWQTGANLDEFVYDGNAHTPEYTLASAYSTLKIEVTGKQTNAGEYYAFAVLTSDPANRNYELDTTNATHKFVIKPQSVTAVWTDGATDTFKYGYDGTKHEPTATIAAVTLNIDGGTTQTVTFTVSVTGGEINAGKYSATAAITNKNFEISNAKQAYEIEKASITVTADDKTVTYGDTAPAFKVTVTGSIASTDSAASLVSAVKYGCAYVQYSPVTTTGYAITPYGLDLANYNVTYVSGKVTVQPKPITVKIKDLSSTYGADPKNPDERVTGWTIDNWSDILTGEFIGIDLIIVDGTNTEVTAFNKGVYSIIANPADGGWTNKNYAVTFESAVRPTDDFGKYTVSAATLTVTANNHNIEYGTANAAIGDSGVTYSGWLNGDDANEATLIASFTGAITFTTTYDSTDAAKRAAGGNYTITPNISALSDPAGNYTFTAGAAAKLTVEKRNITVEIKNYNKPYDGATTDNALLNPTAYDSDLWAVSSTYGDGFASWDMGKEDLLGVKLSRAGAATATTAGVYVITGTIDNTVLGSIAGNYNVTFEAGLFEIDAYEIVVYWVAVQDFSLNPDGSDYTAPAGGVIKYTYDGASHVPVAQYVAANGSWATLTTSGARINAGTGYIAEAYLPNSNNYVFKTAGNDKMNFEIAQRTLTITWLDGDNAAIMGGTVPEYGYVKGKEQGPTVLLSGMPAGVTLTEGTDYVVTGKRSAEGNGTVTITFLNANYTAASSACTQAFEIKAVIPAGLQWYDTASTGGAQLNGVQPAYTYNGESQHPIIKSGASGSDTYSYALYKEVGGNYVAVTSAIGVGKYKVVATPTSDNYKLDDTVAFQGYVEFTITAKLVTLEWVNVLGNETDGWYYNYNGDVQKPDARILLIDGSYIGLAVTYSDNNSKEIGTGYTATVTLPADYNYAIDDGSANGVFTATITYEIKTNEITVEWDFGTSTWITDTSGEWTASYNALNLADVINKSAKMAMTYSNEGVELEYNVYRVDGGKKVKLSNPDSITDAGTYLLKVEFASSNNPAVIKNYSIKGGEQQLTINKRDLTVTPEAMEVDYGSTVSSYIVASFNGFLEDTANGIDETTLINDITTTISGKTHAVHSGNSWLMSRYTSTTSPDTVFEIQLTDNAAVLEWLNGILKNYNYTVTPNVTIKVKAMLGDVKLVGDTSENGDFRYDGTAKLPYAYYKNGSGSGDWGNLTVEIISDPNSSPLTDGKAVNAGTYYIRVKADNPGVVLNRTEFTFTINKRDIVAGIEDRSYTYGEITQGNYKSKLIWNYAQDATGYNTPVAGDDLAITLDVRFGTNGFDDGGYAKAGSYRIAGAWDTATYGDNYEVIFEGSQTDLNGRNSEGLFEVNKAEITVSKQGTQWFNEEGILQKGDYHFISLAAKENGVYKFINYAGWQSATVKVEYSGLYNRNQNTAPAPEDETGWSTTLPSINRAGEWVVNYKINIDNHKELRGQWYVLIKEEGEYVIVIFQKNYEITYGDEVSANLAETLIDGNYVTVSGPIAAADLKRVSTAYAYNGSKENVGAKTNVGSYPIYFELDSTVPDNYRVIYKRSNADSDSNEDRYIITPRTLTVDWGETNFVFDDKVHVPENVKLSGWVDGTTLDLNGLEVGKTKTYAYSDNGQSNITVSVVADEQYDFKTTGGHLLTVSVDNANYKLDIHNAAKTVSISLEDPIITVDGALPDWAFYAIGGAGAVALLTILILAVKVKKRKAAVDNDGFYDEASE